LKERNMKIAHLVTRNAVPLAFVLALIGGCAVAEGHAGQAGATTARTFKSFPDPPKPATTGDPSTSSSQRESAVFAGGCFWGVQGVFERVKGVEKTVAGYSGGSAATAHYDIVSTGTTGHAESVQVTFNPSFVSYGTLLKIFFSVVQNPTELNYQGPDHGTQYRSVVFYETPEQKAIAEGYIRKLTAAKVFGKPIVTQVVPFKAFYPAEQYHQHFMDKHPNYPYIVMWDRPKVETLKQMYPTLVRSNVGS